MTRYKPKTKYQDSGDHENDSDQYSIDNLDLLNLRTCFSSESLEKRKYRRVSESYGTNRIRVDCSKFHTPNAEETTVNAQRFTDSNNRNYETRKIRKPLHPFTVFKPHLPTSDAEDFSENNSENDKNSVVVLYERPKKEAVRIEKESLNQEESNLAGNNSRKSQIVGPRKMTVKTIENSNYSFVKKLERNNNHNRSSRKHCGDCGDKKEKLCEKDLKGNCGTFKNSFPFKYTPSGNLKVEPTQVVFQSEKLSVLVSNPATKVKVNMEKERKDFVSKMSMVLPLMNSSSGGMGYPAPQGVCNNGGEEERPNRHVMSESSEYEGIHTDNILRPELNLQRLGFNGTEGIDWNKVSLPQKANLYLELYQRITNYINADMKVYIDNEEFHCHLLVLQCYSKYFDEVNAKTVELPSKLVSPLAFSFIYEWMITGQPAHKNLGRDNVLEIFIAARYLRIKDLEEQCWAFIDSQEVFSEDTAFMLYLQAKHMQMYDVMELMVPRISKFFLMLVSSQDWLELDLEEVCAFLGSNYIQVNCEMEVIMSAVRWLKHDWDTRKQHVVDIIRKVRFGHMAPWQLVEMKRNRECPEFHQVMTHPEVNRMIDDGLAYVIVRYWYGNHDSDYYNWLNALELEAPAERCWFPSERTFLTYREFLIYLDLYRKHQLSEKGKSRDWMYRGAVYEEPLIRPIDDLPNSNNNNSSNNNNTNSLLVSNDCSSSRNQNNRDFEPGTVPTIDEFLANRKVMVKKRNKFS